MDGGRALVAILAGGAGTRLAGAKPASMLAGSPLVSYPLRAAREAGLDAVLVTKRSVALPGLEAEVVYEPELPRHPLCGMLAALSFAARRSPSSAVVTVACDMPFLTGPLLAWLAAYAPGDPSPAVVVELGGRIEPLLGRYLPAHGPILERALHERRSLRSAVALLEPRRIEQEELRRFGEPERLCFNVNDAGDLQAAHEWLAPAGERVPAPTADTARSGSA
jgi:molybdenum cofactor guanylyltransferase